MLDVCPDVLLINRKEESPWWHSDDGPGPELIPIGGSCRFWCCIIPVDVCAVNKKYYYYHLRGGGRGDAFPLFQKAQWQSPRSHACNGPMTDGSMFCIYQNLRVIVSNVVRIQSRSALVAMSWKEEHASMMAVTIGPDKDRLLNHCMPPLCNTRIPPRVDVLKKWRPLWGTLVSGRFQCFYLELLKFFNWWWKKFPERKPHPHNGRQNRSRQGQVVKDSS